MADYYLGKQQNAVTNTGLDGEPVDVPRRKEARNHGGVWNSIKNAYYKDR